jgi:hypothetical protein
MFFTPTDALTRAIHTCNPIYQYLHNCPQHNRDNCLTMILKGTAVVEAPQ